MIELPSNAMSYPLLKDIGDNKDKMLLLKNNLDSLLMSLL